MCVCVGGRVSHTTEDNKVTVVKAYVANIVMKMKKNAFEIPCIYTDSNNRAEGRSRDVCVFSSVQFIWMVPLTI